MRWCWLTSAGLALGLWTTSVFGQETPWQPVHSAAQRPAGVSLGAPVADPVIHYSADEFVPDYGFTQAGFRTPPPVVAASTGVTPAPQAPAPPPTTYGHTVYSPPAPGYSQTVTANQAPPPPPPGATFIDNPVPPGDGGLLASGPFLGCEALGCTTCATRNLFQSDHCFDYFISPVSNPFLFEDPRSLTEIRPIYIFQVTPNSNLYYSGGTLNWLGFQTRLAVTERLTFTMNKFGAIWSDPNQPADDFQNHGGFSEIWMGPKYTFLRNESTRTLGAFGVTFQIPCGPSQVFQDTGTITVSPYLTFAQNFGRGNLGSFNFMTTIGYSFGDERRTDYFYNSYHLDLDLFNQHKIYPLIELNWVAYTDNGGARNLNFEGRDLMNFGATSIDGKDSLTLAFGARYKFSETLQTGAAFEFPLIRSPDLLNFRMTFDMIVRY